MGKWNAIYDSRKYNAEWEKDHTWLQLKDGACFCKLCKCTITKFKKHNLIVHEKSAKHQSKVTQLQYSSPINKYFVQTIKEEQKIFDVKFSVAIACHCSIRAVDCLSSIIKEHGKGSELQNIRLHRTKCTSIIKNVIGVSLKDALMEDLKDSNFSILIDESTDVSLTKILCLCIKYFSPSYEAIKTDYLGIVSVSSTTGAILFESVEKYLENFNLDLKNCVGFSSDGASNVCGAYNSVLSRIKTINPNIIFMKCSCHSLDLCCDYAMKKLPSNIDYLIAEIARWFKCSSLRREEYKTIFSIMNDGCTESTKFVSPCNTRWLVRSKCIYAILTQWEELKAYFNVISDKDRNYHARIIKEMLEDKRNFLYLTFILPILQEFEYVNSLFQATNADFCSLFADLRTFIKSLENRIEKKCMGAKFEVELKICDLSLSEKETLYERCSDFLQEAYTQANKRLDDNFSVAENISLFHPKNCLSQVRKELKKFSKVILNFAEKNIAEIEQQYNKLLFVDWKKQFPNDEIPNDPITFWAKVINYKNCLGVNCYKELAEIAISLFSLPVSNAFVERVFSFVTNVKSKQRNKINVPLLDAILRIKCHLNSDDGCCRKFKVSDRMLKIFTSKMYESANVSSSISMPGPSSVNVNTEEDDLSAVAEIPF